SSGESGRQGRRSSPWASGSSSAQKDEDKLDPYAPRFQGRQVRPAQFQVSQQDPSAQSREGGSSSIRGSMLSHHSRLAGYTAPAMANPFGGSLPQSYQGTAGQQFQPASQHPYSPPFQAFRFQSSNELASYTLAPTREQTISPWDESISPQWSWQSHVPSSLSSQRSSPQHTPRWDSISPPLMPLNVNRPQSAIRQDTHPQIPHTLLPSMTSLSLDITRHGNQSNRGVLNPLRPPAFSHGSFSRGELAPSPTHATSIERSSSFDTSHTPSAHSPIPSQSGAKAPAPLQAPLPQNLRGDPFRSAKVKTELCRYYNTPKGCVFGDKCNYAHGEQELKFNKLMDLEAAQLIDVEVFRTHPCFTWVATGACPFDQRCTRLHDPRINGLQPSWLPHAEVLITHVGRGLNVDKMYHQQFCAVYSCCPVYGFAPKKKWRADESSTREAWQEFYSFCCSMDASQSDPRSGPWPVCSRLTKDAAHRSNIPEISEMHRLEMALIMRERRKAQYFTFLPSHLFCGELCMVLQTSYFRLEVVESFQNIKRYQVVEISEEEASKCADVENLWLVIAREIAFGPIADASVRPAAVWFNIPEEDFAPCTRQQARRHKRSRHRLREKRDYKNQPEEIKISTSCTIPPFNCCQPVDDAAFDLITRIQKHRLRVVKYFSASSDDKALRSLALEEETLLKCFESQRRFWVTWTWPKRTGSNYIDHNTDVPDVDGAYSFVTYGNRAYGEDTIFFGIDKPSKARGNEVISEKAKLATGLIWKSFVMNLQLVSDRGAVDVPSQEEQMPDHDAAVSQVRRIRTLRNLSLGRPAVRNSPRTPPSLNPQYCSFTSVTMSLDGLIREWTALQHEYEENSSNPLKEAQMDKDKPPDPDRRRSLSYLFDEAAKSWTRALPEYSD
ncbi:hypothetical protein HJC23_011678, partial [Cyclotella cryptica]